MFNTHDRFVCCVYDTEKATQFWTEPSSFFGTDGFFYFLITTCVTNDPGRCFFDVHKPKDIFRRFKLQTKILQPRDFTNTNYSCWKKWYLFYTIGSLRPLRKYWFENGDCCLLISGNMCCLTTVCSLLTFCTHFDEHTQWTCNRYFVIKQCI